MSTRRARPATARRRRGRSPAGSATIADARTTPPAWIRDADRKMPVVSITGTNGKSTVTRLTTHILVRRRAAGRDDDVRRRPRQRADGRARRLDRARRGVADPRPVRPRRRASSRPPAAGSSCAAWATSRTRSSVLTNVTLRPPRPPGHPHAARAGRGQVDRRPGDEARRLGVLNADDPLVAALASRVRGHVAMFTLVPGGSARVRRHAATSGDGRGYAVGWRRHRGARRASRSTPIIEVGRVPITIGGVARHNVANASPRRPRRGDSGSRSTRSPTAWPTSDPRRISRRAA